MRKWLLTLPITAISAILFVTTAASWLIPISIGLRIGEQSNDRMARSEDIFHLLTDVRLWENLVLWQDSELAEFHQTGTAEHLQFHQTGLQELESKLQSFAQIAPVGEKADVTLALQRVGEYRAGFTEVVEAIRLQGFKDWGLEGRWRVAAHQLEAEFRVSRTPLYQELLEMRRNEKDYLLRRDEQYARIVDSYIESLQRKTALLATGGQPGLLKRLEEYALAFRQFRELDARIGRRSEAGLIRQMRESRRVLEPLVMSFKEEASQSRLKNLQRFTVIFYLTGPALGLLVAAVVALLLRAQRHEREMERIEEIHRASEAKSRFLAGVSHELRNPLSAIIGFSDLLEEETAGRLSESEKRKLSHIQNSGDHMRLLVDDILDLSRIEAGKIRLRRTLIAFRDILREVLPSVEPAAAEKKLNLRADLDVNIEVFADPLRFKQILINLIGNAVKFTPAGGAVEIGVKSSNGSACLFVRDNGPGIAPEDQARVFEEFFRSAKDEDSVKGTGLGLAITRRLVEQHGGKIWVESAPGKGTEFFFTIPQTAS